MFATYYASPDSKVHGANMGLIWGRQDPDGPHVDPMNFAIWVMSTVKRISVGIAVILSNSTEMGFFYHIRTYLQRSVH